MISGKIDDRVWEEDVIQTMWTENINMDGMLRPDAIGEKSGVLET